MGHESYQRNEPLRTSTNRVFGLVFAAVFLIVACLPLISGRPIRIWAVAVSAAFLLLGLFWSKPLGPLNRLWMRFGALLHRIVNPVILGLMFFVVITPVGLLMRAFGKDPLRLKFQRGTAGTYWISREPPGPPPDSLERQF